VSSKFPIGAALLWLCAGGVFGATCTVTNTNDSGAGSLRQAILDCARAPGPNVIEFDISGNAPFVIKPQGQLLPSLKGPLVVRLKRAASDLTPAPAPAPPSVVLDGSSLVKPHLPAGCPIATAGLTVGDSHAVEISGLEVRNFCVGIAVVRSNDVFIHDVRIVDNRGAAGVLFTGDDGKGGSTNRSFNNRLFNSAFVDNGTGVALTRGTRDSIVQGATISLTQALPEAAAVEFSSGDNNAAIGNTFSKFAGRAVAISGNHYTIRDNKFVDNKGIAMRASGKDLLILGNTFLDNGGVALTVSGAGARVQENVISGSGGQGVLVAGGGVTLSRNSIFNNGRLGIDAATAAAAGSAVRLPNCPQLSATSKWGAEGLVLNGTLVASPNQAYAIEVFGSRAADHHTGDEKGWGEGERYLGTRRVTTDAAGKAEFSIPVNLTDPFSNGQGTGYFTATATDANGSTSKFSRSLQITK